MSYRGKRRVLGAYGRVREREKGKERKRGGLTRQKREERDRDEI